MNANARVEAKATRLQVLDTLLALTLHFRLMRRVITAINMVSVDTPAVLATLCVDQLLTLRQCVLQLLPLTYLVAIPNG